MIYFCVILTFICAPGTLSKSVIDTVPQMVVKISIIIIQTSICAPGALPIMHDDIMIDDTVPKMVVKISIITK